MGNKKALRMLGDAILDGVAVELKKTIIPFEGYTWEQDINHKTNTITTKITFKGVDDK